MRLTIHLVCFATLLTLLTLALPAFAEEHNALVITFKDGRQQTIPLSDVAHIEFKTVAPSVKPVAVPAAPGIAPPMSGSFLGKWKVGESGGLIDSVFYITLHRDGTAEKTIGGVHGTWAVVNGEAQITWEDGWHDAIRKAGKKFEKAAFEPGHKFSDPPTNVARAEKTDAEPI
jgi:hypothetical protein